MVPRFQRSQKTPATDLVSIYCNLSHTKSGIRLCLVCDVAPAASKTAANDVENFTIRLVFSQSGWFKLVVMSLIGSTCSQFGGGNGNVAGCT